nr:HK97 family phage prohead protease [Paenibacillus dendritiformis]
MTDTVYELYKGGFMKATSVGFPVKEFEPRQGGGTLYKKQELLELSAVPVPANPEALKFAKSIGLVTNATEKFFSDDEIIIEIVDDEIEIQGINSVMD